MDNDDSCDFQIMNLIKRSQIVQNNLLHDDTAASIIKTVALTTDFMDFKNKTKWIEVIPPVWDSDQQDGYVQNIVDDFFLAATKNIDEPVHDKILPRDELSETKYNRKTGEDNIAVVTTAADAKELLTTTTTTMENSFQQTQKKKKILKPSSIDFKNKSVRKKDGSTLTPTRKPQSRLCSERHPHTMSQTSTILEISQQANNKLLEKNKREREFYSKPIDFTEMHPEWKLDVAIDHDFMVNNAKGDTGGGKQTTLFPRRVPNPNHVPNLIHDQKTIKGNHEDSCHKNISEFSLDRNVGMSNKCNKDTEDKEKWVHFTQIAEKVFGNDVKRKPHRGGSNRKWSDIFNSEDNKKILKYSPINLSSYCDDEKLTDGNSAKRIIIEHAENENKVSTERQFNIHHLPIISIRGDCRIQKLHKIIIVPTNGEQTHQSDAKAIGINQEAKILPNENVKYFQFVYKSQCEEEQLERKVRVESGTTVTTSMTKNNQVCDEKKASENNKIFNNDNNLENSIANGKTFEEFINQFSDKVRTEKDIKTSGVDIAVATDSTAGVADANVNVKNEGNLLRQVNSNGKIRKFETMANITNEEYRDLVAELMANVECSDDDDDRGAANAVADGLNRAGGNKYLAPFNLNAKDDKLDIVEGVDNKINNDSEQDNQFEYCDDTFENPNSITHLTKSSENKVTNESPSVNSSVMDFDMSGSIIAKSDISMSLTDDEKLSSRFTVQNNNNNIDNNKNKTKSDEVINIYDISKTENQFNDDESKLILDAGWVGHNYETTLPMDMLRSCAVKSNTSKSHVSQNDNKLQMCDRGHLKYKHHSQYKNHSNKQQQLKLENINLLENDKVIKAANGNHNNNNNNDNVIVFQPNNNKNNVSVNEIFNNRLSMYDVEWVANKQQHKEQQNAFRNFIAETTATAVNENINRVIIQSSNSRQEDYKEKNRINVGGNSKTVNFVYKNLYESNTNKDKIVQTETEMTTVTDGKKVCTIGDGLIHSVSGNNVHCNSKNILNDNDGNISCRNLLDVTELRNTLHSVGMKLIDLQQRRLKGDVIKHLDNIYDDIKSQNDENMVLRRQRKQQQQREVKEEQQQHILQHNNGATIMGINVVSCNKGNWQSQHIPSVSSMMVGEVTNEVDKRQFINMTANHHLTKTNCCTESTKCENYITVENENTVDCCRSGNGTGNGNCEVKGLCFDKSIPENYRFKNIEMTPTPIPSIGVFESPQYVAGDNIRQWEQQQQYPVLSQQQCIVDNSNTITSLKNNKTDGININNNNNNNNKQDSVNPNQCQKMFFSSSSHSQCEFNVVKNCCSSLYPLSPSKMVFCCSDPKCSNKNRNYHLNSCNCIQHSHALNKCNCFMCCQARGSMPVECVTTETQTIKSQPSQEVRIEPSADYKSIENPFTNYQRPLLPRRQLEKPIRYNHKEFQRLVLESSPKMGKTIKSIIQNSGNHQYPYNKLLEDSRINVDKSQKAVKRFLNSIKQKINRTNLRYKESDLLSSDFSSVDDDLLRNTSSSNYSSEDKDYSVRNNKMQRKLVTGRDNNIARNIILREIQTNSDNKDTTDTAQTAVKESKDSNRVKIVSGYNEKCSTQRILPRYPLEWPYIDTSSDFQNNSVYSTSSIEFQIAKLKLVSGGEVDDNNEFEVTPHISPVTSSCASLLSSNDDNILVPKTVRAIEEENNSLSDGEILSQGEIRSNGSGF